MTKRKTIVRMFIGLSFVMGARTTSTSIKIDATDGDTLNSTFHEAVASYEKPDQFKAAAGLLIYAYEGANADTKLPQNYINEAIEEAPFLLDSKKFEAESFDDYDEVMHALATLTNGILDGKTAQDLIEHYNVSIE